MNLRKLLQVIAMFWSSMLVLFVLPIATIVLVECQTEPYTFAGHIDDLPDIESVKSATLWIAPDDVIATQISNLKPMSCPGSNLIAVATRALRLSSRRVVFRPLCTEGLILYKTKVSVLVDAKGPTYCALIISSADQIHVRDIIFDHGDCVNASMTNAGIHSVLTADSTAALILRPRASRLDSQTTFQNLTFQSMGNSVAVLLSPPSWEQTLRLDGPSFTGMRSRTEGLRFVALLVAGRLELLQIEALSIIILRDPAAGLDRSTVTSTGCQVTDLFRDMDTTVLMRLRQAIEIPSRPSTCPITNHPPSHSTTLIAIGFSLTALLTVCVFILLVHSCRSTEAQDLAPYRVEQSVFEASTTPTI